MSTEKNETTCFGVRTVPIGKRACFSNKCYQALLEGCTFNQKGYCTEWKKRRLFPALERN